MQMYIFVTSTGFLSHESKDVFTGSLARSLQDLCLIIVSAPKVWRAPVLKGNAKYFHI